MRVIEAANSVTKHAVDWIYFGKSGRNISLTSKGFSAILKIDRRPQIDEGDTFDLLAAFSNIELFGVIFVI